MSLAIGSLKDILQGYVENIPETIFAINRYLADNLSTYRYEHSLMVLSIALQLARVQSAGVQLKKRTKEPAKILENSKKTHSLIVAALAHDITKEEPKDFHLGIFKKYKQKKYKDYPFALYHAKSAPYFLQERFQIKEREVHHAISYHSTGCKSMPLLSRLVFSADYLASAKDIVLEKEILKPLHELCMEKTSGTIERLVLRKSPVQPESVNFYNILLREIEDESTDG